MTFLFPLPDNASDTMFRVLDHLTEAQIGQVEWGLPLMNVVEVREPGAAIYLRMAFPDRLHGADGAEVLDKNDVLVPPVSRAECERMLREECPGEHCWFQIARVTFDTPEVHKAFQAAYFSVLEGPEPCADRASNPPDPASSL